RERRREDFLAVAVFDVIAGNGDRKSGHCLLGIDGRIWVIDHGLCFSEDPTLRTVIWEFAGESIPEGILDDVRRLHRELLGGDVAADLAALLSPEEIDATARRAEELVAGGRFPTAGPGRSQPWPAI
ncbi:MAG: SCO1664 family protein, partial [Actinomycetota bacterium]